MGSSEVDEACAECTHKCLLVHRKNKTPTPITSFFKVMIGDHFTKVLFLPPKFACTVADLIGQKTHLEDSSGRRWSVTLDNHNGSFAFLQGWHAFALDHGLEVGDFIAFHYIMGSHFVVQIYGKTGCEKIEFSEENSSQKKRTRTNKNSISRDGPCHTIDKGSMNKQSSSISAVSGSDVELIQSQCNVNDVEKVQMATENTSNCENSDGRPLTVSKAEYVEEPYYMINRDLTYNQGEDRSSLFDLSNFEMCMNVSGADKSNRVLVGHERSPHPYDTSLRSQTEPGLVDIDQVAEQVAGRVVPSNEFDLKTIERNNYSDVTDKIPSTSDKDSSNGKTRRHQLTTSAVKPGENGKANLDVTNRVIKKCQISEKRSNISSSERMMAIKKERVETILEQCALEEMNQDIHGKKPEVMKGGQGQSSNLSVKDMDKASKMVKTEAVDSIGFSSPLATDISCLVATDSQSFLELPMCLPSVSGKMKMDRKVVFLRDPVMRVWPVLYHERSDTIVLTSGWEAFSRANNIRPGDKCVFGVESEPEGIYRVRIVRG
ncbi:hypothetical protein L1049_028415 [Liquidambar formosana]|uniref:TF-B3 domain-containing protein n=1 Tax=Liquidambar formosana TaxID=63359 RepID=A0AAP0RMF2_LIQFO